MDDCTLEKLTIKPGKLTPKYHRDVTEYNSTVSSNVDKITIDCMTSDSGASYCIKKSGGSKTIPLEEGKDNEIIIEVTAEDGTIKKYILTIKRLSAKDASLLSLSVDKGVLSPDFSPQVDEYTVSLPCTEPNVLVTASAPDANCELKICGAPPGERISLNVGETLIEVLVGSIDGTITKTYAIVIVRSPVPRYIRITDPVLRLKYEDPVSLAPLYRPVTIRESDPRHTYSEPIILEITKMSNSKFDPLSQLPFPQDWAISDHSIDKALSATVGVIPLTYGGATSEMTLADITCLLKEANVPVKVMEPGDECKSIPVKHSYEVRSWEKQLHKIFDETNAMKLATQASNYIKQYLDLLPKPGASRVFPENEGPLDRINDAAYCYACALKTKKTDANLHMQLGLVLEEKYLSEDMFGLKREGEGTGELAVLNQAVKAGSKEEEILAICVLHGVDERAPLSLVLKALDQEYHAVKNSGQTAKAEHVQSLFTWKNKQATQEGAAAQKASDDQNPLGQAYLKYLDALSCDETKSVYHFHVGRLQVIQGQYDDAVQRLQAALSWNKQHQMARFYLGLALTLRPDGPGERLKEAFGYIQEAMEILLTKETNKTLGIVDKEEEGKLYVQNLIRPTNVHLLRGLISLGKLLLAKPELAKESMSAEDIFQTALLVAASALPTVARGDLYKQIEWVLLEGHDQLLNVMLKACEKAEYIAQRCERLSALIRSCTIGSDNPKLADLQAKTCQALVSIQSCNSQSLYLLGSAQLAEYDLDPTAANATALLEDSKRSLRASIELEGKPSSGEPPTFLTEQKWWQDKNKKEEEPKEQAAPAKTAAPAARGGAAAAKGARGAAAASRGAARGGPAAAKSTSKTNTSAPKQQGGPGRGAVSKPGVSKAAPAARGAKTTPAKPAPAVVETPKEEEPQKHVPPAVPTGPLNRATYHARLALARALSRSDEITESQKYYNDVITMAPNIHDAYIELAEMLTKTDPLAAVDVYCKFPVPENPGFDDAYIFGEIVMLLFKYEKFDHPDLAKNMIHLGQIMGLSYLEKYVKTLEEKFKNTLLQTVYAGVNRKSVDDPDMVQFFKFKCWV